MKNLFLCFLFSTSVFFLQAQKISLTTFTGFSNYQGDLQQNAWLLKEVRLAVGIGLHYDINDQLYATFSIKEGTLTGSDAGNINYLRNLNFTTSITQFQLGLGYDLLDLHEHKMTPYFFAGVAAFHFNPYTYDQSGNKVYLQPLGTEGQGYNGQQKYSLTQIAIPFGGGIKVALNQNIRIGFEVAISKTFTDYIDDVSTNYADRAQLLLNNGQQAVDLAYRGNKLLNGLPYPVAGDQRGNPGHKDLYYFSGLVMNFRLGHVKNRLLDNVRCPAAL